MPKRSGVGPASQTKERAKTKSSWICPFLWIRFSLGKQARFTYQTFVPECPCEKFMKWPFPGLVCRGHSWKEDRNISIPTKKTSWHQLKDPEGPAIEKKIFSFERMKKNTHTHIPPRTKFSFSLEMLILGLKISFSIEHFNPRPCSSAARKGMNFFILGGFFCSGGFSSCEISKPSWKVFEGFLKGLWRVLRLTGTRTLQKPLQRALQRAFQSGVAPANQTKERSVHELFTGAFRKKVRSVNRACFP